MRTPVCLLTLALIAVPAAGQQKANRRAPVGPDRPLVEKLRSPRETLQTLYYAVDVYDYHPSIIADAVACLELGDSMPADSASAALLAVQIECVLNSLEIPLAGVSDRPDAEPVIFKFTDDRAKVHDLTMRRGSDNLWRFDHPTVELIPALSRI